MESNRLCEICAPLCALIALLESGAIEQMVAVTRAWDAGELMPLASV
jgi:hypothetical protein